MPGNFKQSFEAIASHSKYLALSVTLNVKVWYFCSSSTCDARLRFVQTPYIDFMMTSPMQDQFWSHAKRRPTDDIQSPASSPTIDQSLTPKRISSIFGTETPNFLLGDFMPLNQSGRDEVSPSLMGSNWKSMEMCVENVLNNPSERRLAYTSDIKPGPGKDTVSMFLTIFSFSSNLNCVVDVLGSLYFSNPLSDTWDIRIKFGSVHYYSIHIHL